MIWSTKVNYTEAAYINYGFTEKMTMIINMLVNSILILNNK